MKYAENEIFYHLPIPLVKMIGHREKIFNQSITVFSYKVVPVSMLWWPIFFISAIDIPPWYLNVVT